MMLPWWSEMVSSLPIPYRWGGGGVGNLGHWGPRQQCHKLIYKTIMKWDHKIKANNLITVNNLHLINNFIESSFN
jgi:hypothetical protein